ncbi:hypothetical protein JCM5350_001436 [Sporobolomyces pararoseus]
MRGLSHKLKVDLHLWELGEKKSKIKKRKWDGETGAEDEPRIVEWSFKGDCLQDGVDQIKGELKTGDYVSLVVADISNMLVSYFATSDHKLRTRLAREPELSTKLLKERRFQELRQLNMEFGSLLQAFSRAKLVGVYDHSTNRSVHKFVNGSRLERSSVAQGSMLSKQAVREFVKNDVEEGGRKENLEKNGPPQISMDKQIELPPFAPPTSIELEPTIDADGLDLKIAEEAKKLVRIADLVVSKGEADTICRDYLRLKLLPGDPRVESISLAQPLADPVVASEEPGEWISQVEKIEKEHKGRTVIFATDSDHLAINDASTFDFWLSCTSSTSRVVNFAKRSLHPSNWVYTSFSSSAMAMVLAGCDLSTGIRGFTVPGIGTAESASRLSDHRKRELVLLDLCEHALEWRDAHNRLRSPSSPSETATVEIDNRRFTLNDSSQLSQKFDEILKPIYDSASTALKDRLSLSQALERFGVLYGEAHEVQSKKVLQEPIDEVTQERTNAELEIRFASPGSHNHLFTFLHRSKRSSPGPPTAGRSRRTESVPPAGNARLLLPTSTAPFGSLPSQRHRRHSFSTTEPRSIKPHLPYQTRYGPKSSVHLQQVYSIFRRWKSATSPSTDSTSESEPPKKKRRPSGKPKGKGKERETDEQKGEIDEEEKPEESTIARVKAVKGGARDFDMALSTIVLPFRPSSFNDLLFPGLPDSQHFHHALHGTLLDLLNLWLSECPAILDNVRLLLVLYSRFSPYLLSHLLKRGGQKFGDVVATLVQRGAEYYELFPLGTETPSGDTSSLDSAPSWLKDKVEEVLEGIPSARRSEFWNLVDSLRFTEEDFKIFKKNKEFNIFGMIVVKLRRLLKFPPPLLRHRDFICRNFTVCGTSISNASLFRGQRIHRAAALVVVDKTLDFASNSPLNAYGLDDSHLSTVLSSLSPMSRKALSSIPRKRLKRLVSLHIWKSPLPDARQTANRAVQISNNDDDDEEEKEQEAEEEGSTKEQARELLVELLKEVEQEEQDELDEDFEPSEDEDDEDEQMDIDSEEDSTYDGFTARISQIVRKSLPRQDKDLLSSDDLTRACHEITDLLVASTSFALALIGASYLEAVRSFPDGNILKSCKTVAQLVLRGGGKEEKLSKKEKLVYDREEEAEEVGEREEEGWESTKFEKNVEASLLMTLSVEFRIQGGAAAVNFEPVGFHASPHHLRALVTPSNHDYLPQRIIELWGRQLKDSINFNQLVQTKATSTLPDFKVPEVDSNTPASVRHAAKLVEGLITARQKKIFRVQSKTRDKLFFPPLYDYTGLNPLEVPSDGPLATYELTERDASQLKQRSETLLRFFGAVGISNNEAVELWEHEFWKYAFKQDLGDKKIYHGSVYVSREKISASMFNMEKFTQSGLARLRNKIPQGLGARATFESLISSNPKVVKLYLEIERLRLEHRHVTGQPEIIQLRHQKVEGTRTIFVGGKLTKIPRTVTEIVPLPPLLRAVEDTTSPNSGAHVLHVLKFVKPVGASTDHSPQLDNRKATTLYLNPRTSNSDSTSNRLDGQSTWRSWCAEHVEKPVLSSMGSTFIARGPPPLPVPPPPPPPPSAPIASTSTTTSRWTSSAVATTSRRTLDSYDERFPGPLNPDEGYSRPQSGPTQASPSHAAPLAAAPTVSVATASPPRPRSPPAPQQIQPSTATGHLTSPSISRVQNSEPIVKSTPVNSNRSPSPLPQGANSARTSSPALSLEGVNDLIELVRASTQIEGSDGTKEEIVRFLRNPRGYGEGPLSRADFWAFELRRQMLDVGERVDFIILYMRDGTFKLKRSPTTTIPVEFARSLNHAPDRVRGTTPAAASSVPMYTDNVFTSSSTAEAVPSNPSKSDWRSETTEWLQRTRGSIKSTVLVGIDRGRVYKTVEAVVRVGLTEPIEFYRKRSSDALRSERKWNKVLQAVKPLEPRSRLASMFFDPASPTSDLSLLLRRPSSTPGIISSTVLTQDPTSQTWFPSQTLLVPASLQGALLHSPDPISTSLNTVEQDRLQAQIDSEAAKKWNRILPRPNDGSKIQVAIIRSTTNFSDISEVKGHGRDDSRRYEDADVRAIRALPWTEVIEVECSEADSSHVCSTCQSTLIHPCRIGDPALSKILRQYVCIKCIKMINRDDNGALNIISIALGIAAVGKGNVLSPETAKLIGNSNYYLTKRQSIRLENQLHRTLGEKNEEERKKFVEGLSGKDFFEILGLTASHLAELEAEAEAEAEADLDGAEVLN